MSRSILSIFRSKKIGIVLYLSHFRKCFPLQSHEKLEGHDFKFRAFNAPFPSWKRHFIKKLINWSNQTIKQKIKILLFQCQGFFEKPIPENHRRSKTPCCFSNEKIFFTKKLLREEIFKNFVQPSHSPQIKKRAFIGGDFRQKGFSGRVFYYKISA